MEMPIIIFTAKETAVCAIFSYICRMKITILGPAHPYRGGLASIMEIMARTFQRRGNEVDIKTFTLQYPSLLFPGKSQTVSTPPPADLHICRCVNTVNPFNWVRIGRRICRERPDFVLMKYWTPFMAPCFGTIARFARRNDHTKVLCQIDNVEPHEHHLTDKPFNRYYLGVVDGFVYMSEQVHGELKAYSDAPALFSPHPLFENFGERVARNEACVRLGLDPTVDYVLFFGLIRDYKGLDLLLDAWAGLRRRGACRGAQADRRRGILHPQGALPAADCRQRPAGRGDPPRPVHSRRTGEILLLGCGFRRPAL